MTIVATWYRAKFDEVWCLADSRLSSEDLTITDHVPKIMQLPVTTFRFAGATRWEPEHHLSFGYAYAGSSLAATSVFNLTAACTQNLANNKTGNPPPSLSAIASLVKASAEHCIRDMAMRVNHSPGRYYFSAHLFGYCPKSEAFKGFQIEPSLDSLRFAMQVSEMPLQTGKFYPLGTGVDELVSIMKEIELEGRIESGVIPAMTEMMRRGQTRGVGGHLQCAVAKRSGGVRLTPVLATEAGEAAFCGLDVASLSPLDGHNIGCYAVAPFLD